MINLVTKINCEFTNIYSKETMHGKTVLITGGNSGLGLEAVKDLASRGARIIMASRKIDVANKVRGCLKLLCCSLQLL